MKAFNKLFISSECPFCPSIIKVVMKINKKLPINKQIEIINIKDLDNFKVNFYKYLEGIGFDGTPHLILGEIKNGKIIEGINIQGKYPHELIEESLNGYLNDEFLEEYKEDEED